MNLTADGMLHWMELRKMESNYFPPVKDGKGYWRIFNQKHQPVGQGATLNEAIAAAMHHDRQS